MASIANEETGTKSRRSSRSRKAVEKLNYDEREEKKAAKPAFKVPDGAGTRLKDMERVADPKYGTLGKISRNNARYKVIHKLMYDRPGKTFEVKTNVLQFSGYVYDGKNKTRDKQFKKVWGMNLSFLKDLCDLLDIDRSSTSFKEGKVDKESISERVVNWLEKPHAREGKTLQDLIPKPKKPKTKKKKKPKKPLKDPNAPKRAMTSFMVFSGEMRNKVKEENPDMKLVEIASELGRRWKALTDEEKKPYQDKADADKERFNEEMEGYVVPKEFRKRKKRKRSKSKSSSTKKKKAKKSAKKKTKRRTKSITTRPEPLFANSRYMLTKNAPKPSKKKRRTSTKITVEQSSEESEEESEESEDESEESEDESEESEDESEESEEEDDDEELVGVKKGVMIKAIKDFIKGKELETLTTKLIRRAIEAKYSISLSSHKEEFKTMVAGILHG